MLRVVKRPGHFTVDETDARRLVDKIDFEQVTASECGDRSLSCVASAGAFPSIIRLSWSLSLSALCLHVLPVAEELFNKIVIEFARVPRNSERVTYLFLLFLQIFFFHLIFFLVISWFFLPVKCGENEITYVEYLALEDFGFYWFPFLSPRYSGTEERTLGI